MFTFKTLQYSGSTLHDQILTAEDTGTYRWNTALLAPYENKIDMQGTITNDNTSQERCTATIGYAQYNGNAHITLLLLQKKQLVQMRASVVSTLKSWQLRAHREVRAYAGTPLGEALAQWVLGSPLHFWTSYTSNERESRYLSLGFDTTLAKTPVWSYIDRSSPPPVQEIGIGTIATELTYKNMRILTYNENLAQSKKSAAQKYEAYLNRLIAYHLRQQLIKMLLSQH